MFSNAVSLAGEVVLVVQRRQRNLCCNFVHGPTLVDCPNGLIPQELNGVAITLRCFANPVTTRQRRAVRGNQMFGFPRDDVVDSRNQHPRIAVLLAANGKHVEQHWPHGVVHARLQVGKEEVDGVVAVARRKSNLHSLAGDGDFSLIRQRMRDRQEPWSCRRMRRIAIRKAQADVHQTIGAIGWHHDGELFDETTSICGRYLAGSSSLVLRNSSVPMDRQWLHMVAFIEHCLGPFHIVKVGVDHCRNRAVGARSQLLQRKRHLLYRFTRIESDDSIRCIDEGLIRQPIADETPGAGANLVEVAPKHVALGEMVFVYSRAIRRHHGALAIWFEAARCHLAPRRTPSSWHTMRWQSSAA